MAGQLPRDAQISVAASSSMFPGFRFSPTDEELLSFYLRKKIEGNDSCVQVIAEVEISKHEPWDLPAKSVIKSENEWFFFTPRGRNYPKGSQSKRATELGYWKATGKERNVKSGSTVIGTKRTLVFHVGLAPKGERTEWIMHEYCMKDMVQDTMAVCRLRKNSQFRLNDGPSQEGKANLTTHDDNNPIILEDGIDPFDLLDGAKVGDLFSKEYCDSADGRQLESRSAGQHIGSVPDGLFDSSSHHHHQQGHEDGLFADILNDDIVDLDKSFLPPTPDLLPQRSNLSNMDTFSQHGARAIPASANPVQGNAIRRTRFKQNEPWMYGYGSQSWETEASNGLSVFCPSPNLKDHPICLVGLLVDKRVSAWTKLVLLFELFFYVVLFILLFRY